MLSCVSCAHRHRCRGHHPRQSDIVLARVPISTNATRTERRNSCPNRRSGVHTSGRLLQYRRGPLAERKSAASLAALGNLVQRLVSRLAKVAVRLELGSASPELRDLLSSRRDISWIQAVP